MQVRRVKVLYRLLSLRPKLALLPPEKGKDQDQSGYSGVISR
jgi:hypothetical protein